MTQDEQIQTIPPETLATWLDEGNVYLVDVREEHEFEAARIAGAICLPLSKFDPKRIPDKTETQLVLHCQSGVRCGTAAKLLKASGFKNTIFRLEGGILAWGAHGEQIQIGDD